MRFYTRLKLKSKPCRCLCAWKKLMSIVNNISPIRFLACLQICIAPYSELVTRLHGNSASLNAILSLVRSFTRIYAAILESYHLHSSTPRAHGTTSMYYPRPQEQLLRHPFFVGHRLPLIGACCAKFRSQGVSFQI